MGDLRPRLIRGEMKGSRSAIDLVAKKVVEFPKTKQNILFLFSFFLFHKWICIFYLFDIWLWA